MALSPDRIKALAIELAACVPAEIKRPVPSPTHPALRGYDWYEENLGLPVVEQTPRARALRRIRVIAAKPGWSLGITKALDKMGASSAEELTDSEVDSLLETMEAYELAAQTCCDNDDDPPAR